MDDKNIKKSFELISYLTNKFSEAILTTEYPEDVNAAHVVLTATSNAYFTALQASKFNREEAIRITVNALNTYFDISDKSQNTNLH